MKSTFVKITVLSIVFVLAMLALVVFNSRMQNNLAGNGASVVASER